MSGSVLVTGGAGFLGSHLVEALLARGQNVSVLDDLSRGRRAWVPAGVDLHGVDLRDADAVRRAVAAAGAEVVVHLAALHFIPAVDGAPELAQEVNVGATRVLLDELLERPPAVLAFASTAAVYPDRPGPIDEECAPAPIDLYGRTKLEGEALVQQFGNETGSRIVIGRLFNIIGRRETNPHVVPEIISQIQSGDGTLRLGNTDARRDYIDVRDVAEGFMLLLARELEGTFNIGAGRSVSVTDLVRLAGAIVGEPLTVAIDERRRRTVDRAELVADASLLRSRTGWQPQWSLEATLADLLAEAAESGRTEAGVVRPG